MTFLSASEKFRLNSPSGFNIPRPKFLFYVNFVSRFLDPIFLGHTSFFVKTFERINLSYDVQEVNQYNKKRLIQTGIKYGPLNFSMYDVVDNTALKLIEAYNRFYYGDFQNKNNNSWNYDVVTNNFEFTNNWGLKANQSPSDSYFFDRIELFEMYDQTYTKINFINPKFTAIDFQNFDMESSEFSTVNLSCKYEGIVVEKINEMVTPELADMFGLPFHSDFGLPTGAYRIPGVQNLITAGTGLLSNVFSTLGFGSFASDNIASALTLQGLSSLGKNVNSTFGTATFDNIEKSAQLINSIENRTASGDIVRDISTGNFTRATKSLFI